MAKTIFSGRRGQGLRRGSVVLATLGLVASYGLVLQPSLASAVVPSSSLPGSTFEIDQPSSNLTVEGSTTTTPPALDWLNNAGTGLRAGVVVQRDATNSTADDSFTQGTATRDEITTIGTGSIPNNKSDLRSFGVYKESTDTRTFLDVFWSRVQAPSGTTTVDFEFNQSKVLKNKPYTGPQVIPQRTPGDLLVSYELASGGTHPDLFERVWQSDGTWSDPPTALGAGAAIGSINTSTLLAAQTGGLGQFDPFTFGEASLDVASLVPGDQGCTTYGSVYVKTRSSDTLTDELKDFIAPEPISISNCGSVRIHKTDANGDLAGAGFTLYKNVAPLTGTRGDEDTVTTLTCSSLTGTDGYCTIPNVPKGEYWVHESTVPGGHDAAADQRVTVGTSDTPVDLSFVDPIQHATITVTKDAQPDDAQAFPFTLTGQPDFSLVDNGPADPATNTKTFTVPVGSYTLAEGSTSGWTRTGLLCTGTGGHEAAGGSVAITLAKDQAVSCTYTNAFTTRGVNLQTTASAGRAAGTWVDAASLTGDGTHPVTGTVDFYACDAHPTKTACTTGGTQVGTGAVAVTGSGTAYAATSAAYTPSAAGWTCFRAEYTSTSAFYLNDSHTNDSTECFLKQAADLTVSKTATPAFGRVYSWTIGKSVDHTTVSIPAGGTATSAYDVAVGNSFLDGSWTVAGDITVHNPNLVDVAGVDVTDAIDNNTGGSCAVTSGTNRTVPHGGDLVLHYTCSYAATGPTAPNGTNTATATWDSTAYSTPDGSATGTKTVDFSTVTPSVTDAVVDVTDTVEGALGTLDARTMTSNPAHFRYTVDRSGVAGTCTDYPNTASFLSTTSTASGSASASVRVCVGSDLTVGTAGGGAFDRTDLWSIVKRVDRTRVTVAQGGSATFSYEVQVDPAGVSDSSYRLSGSVTVTNPNDWEDITATVTEASDLGGGVSCAVTGGTGVVVPKSGHVDLPYTCSFTGTPATSGHVTGTATWSAATAHTPNGSASGTSAAALTLAHETNASVTVVDDKTDPANPVVLGTVRTSDEGGRIFRYSLTKQGVAGQCTDYTNIATIRETEQAASKTVTVCVGQDLQVSKTALATDHRTYQWLISKTVDRTTASVAPGTPATFRYGVTVTPNGTTDSGWSGSGQVTVTNPNAWEDIAATVSDVTDTGGGASCAFAGSPNVIVKASSSVVLSYTCTFTSAPTDGTNTATATWDAQAASTPHGSATGTASMAFVPNGQTNQTITVVDDKTDPAHPVTLGTATYGDGPKTFTYALDQQGTAGQCESRTNIATIVQTGQSDRQTATVCSGAALTVTPTSAATYDRTYGWGISKSVDQTRVVVAPGGTATFTYTVTASENGHTDSGYTLQGSVTVTNPNAWEDVVTTVTVGSDVGGGATCTVTDGVARTVPRGGSLSLAYQCAFTGAPAATGTTTATATWDPAAAATSAGSTATGSATAFALAGETNKTVSVTDDMTDPAHPVSLGQVTVGVGSKAFTYSLNETSPDGVCTDRTNVATIVETGQTAQQVATTCAAATGGGGGPVTVPTQLVVIPAPVAHPTTAGAGLPRTGDDTGALLRLAVSMLVLGGALSVWGRRRQA